MNPDIPEVARRAFLPGYAVHPGETIAEWLAERGMSQVELAKRISMSPKALNQMIRGHAPVTAETSLRLEAVTGIPARTWNALQALYTEDSARLDRDARLAEHVSFLDRMPVKALRERGIVTANNRDKVAVLRQVLDFFGVADVGAWECLWESPSAAYRKSPAFQAEPGAVAVWLRLGELAAHQKQVQAFKRERLIASLGKLRRLTLEPDPQIFVSEMTRICAESGVVVVFVPDVQGSRCSGATRWLSGRPVIQLSLRHKTDDHLWFTFFHELGHVLLHSRNDVFIDGETAVTHENELIENEADVFAQETLIPEEHEQELATLGRLSDIVEFAQRIGVSSGIVVGRLQHEGIIGYAIGNNLKRRYTFAAAT